MMRSVSILKTCVAMICALFVGNAVALEQEPTNLAAVMKEPKAENVAKPGTDNQIADQVRDKFVKEKLFGKDSFADMGIHVTVKKGAVTLTGKVGATEDVEKALKSAKEVEGVKSVQSKIVVKEPIRKDKKDAKKAEKKADKKPKKKAESNE